MLTYLSLFSGIGGFDLGFDRAGMVGTGQVEWDAKARGVLRHHWPNTRHYEDVRHVGRNNLPAVDLVCGGFPCQDVSVAGKRAGLAGERSGLWFEFLRILTELKPRWVVIENVPGLLSSNGGADFATVVYGLAERGYGVSYRVLDAQYFGVPQRRRRVFIVASLGNGRSAEVLFERESRTGDFEPRRTSGQGAAGYADESLRAYRFQSFGEYTESHNASTCKARDGKDATDLIALDVRNMRSNGDVSGTLQSKATGGYSLNYVNPIAFMAGHGANAGDPSEKTIIAFDRSKASWQDDITGPLRVGGAITPGVNGGKSDHWCVMFKAGHGVRSVFSGYGVRRLTPVECERLQGFPDGWTAVNGQSDSTRYKQLGNAVAVPVAEWLGERIMQAEWRRIWEGEPIKIKAIAA